MIELSKLEAWFVTGSQHLYGPETLKQVDTHANSIGKALGRSEMPSRSSETSDDTQRGESAAVPGSNNSRNCVGLILGCIPSHRRKCGLPA